MGREGMRASVMARSLLVVRSEGSGMGQDVIGWTVSLIIDWWGGGEVWGGRFPLRTGSALLV